MSCHRLHLLSLCTTKTTFPKIDIVYKVNIDIKSDLTGVLKQVQSY